MSRLCRNAPLPVSAAAPALLALLVLSPSSAEGEQATVEVVPSRGEDYLIENRRWNGLSTLAALAQGFGWRVEQRERVEWPELSSGDVLFLLYPTRVVEPADLSTFIRGGGRVLIADDFGHASPLFADLGILREERRGVAAERFHDDLPHAPIARALAPEHPLAAGVTDLVGNHPAVLPEVDGPTVVFAFGPGEATVAAGELGAGRYVVMSDPSMLINRMLEFQGNLDFTVRLLRYLGRPDRTERLIILTGEIAFRGKPSGLIDEQGESGGLSHLLHDFNTFLHREVNAYILTDPGVRLAAVVVGLGAALAILLALPLARRQVLDGRWTRAGSDRPGDDHASVAATFDRPRRKASFMLPAAILRDTVNAKLSRILGVREPLYSLRRGEILSALEQTRSAEAAAALRPILPLLRALPTRAQAASPYEATALSRSVFERLQADVARLYRTLGEE